MANSEHRSGLRKAHLSADDPNPEAGRARNVQVADIVLPGVTGSADMLSSSPR